VRFKTRALAAQTILFTSLAVISLGWIGATGCSQFSNSSAKPSGDSAERTTLAILQDRQERFRPAELGRVISAPQDLAPHRDAGYEWWYWTGHSFGKSQPGPSDSPIGGFQVTLFRVSRPQAAKKLGVPLTVDGTSGWIVHLSASDFAPKKFYHSSFAWVEPDHRIVVARDSLVIRMPGFSLKFDRDSQKFFIQAKATTLSGDQMEFDLTLSPTKPWVLHGDRGYSKKGTCSTCASHYLSSTRLKGEGRIAITSIQNKSQIAWTRGFRSWFDQEFGANTLGGVGARGGSEPEASVARGWDWFSVQLDSGEEWMAFRLRGDSAQKNSDAQPELWKSGTWVSKEGQSRSIRAEDLAFIPVGQWISPESKARYPTEWRVRIENRDWIVRPRWMQQEIVGSHHPAELATYWEGAVEIFSDSGERVGIGYLEMTGYDRSARPQF
jgi:predicted secreted hydrolase